MLLKSRTMSSSFQQRATDDDEIRYDEIWFWETVSLPPHESVAFPRGMLQLQTEDCIVYWKLVVQVDVHQNEVVTKSVILVNTNDLLGLTKREKYQVRTAFARWYPFYLQPYSGKDLVELGVLLRKQCRHNNAFKLFESAVRLEYPEAFGWLAQALYFGEGCTQDYFRSASVAQAGMQIGDTMSTAIFGRCLCYGQGVDKDVERGYALCQQSADAGNMTGLYFLGWCHQYGRGVPQNQSYAFKLYQQSANMGYDYAQNNLGYCYGTGTGVTEDRKRALQLHQRACDQGNPFG